MERVCENCQHWIEAYNDAGNFVSLICALGVNTFTACACAGTADYFEPNFEKEDA